MYTYINILWNMWSAVSENNTTSFISKFSLSLISKSDLKSRDLIGRIFWFWDKKVHEEINVKHTKFLLKFFFRFFKFWKFELILASSKTVCEKNADFLHLDLQITWILHWHYKLLLFYQISNLIEVQFFLNFSFLEKKLWKPTYFRLLISFLSIQIQVRYPCTLVSKSHGLCIGTINRLQSRKN